MSDSKYHYNKSVFKNPVEGEDFYIYQVGELYSNENTVFTEHRQVCDEISFIISGKGTFSTNGRKHPVQKGDCYFSFKNEMHMIESGKNEPLRFYFCGFSPKSERAVQITEEIKKKNCVCIECCGAQDCFSKMIDEIWTEGNFSVSMLDAQLLQLLISLSRGFKTDLRCESRPSSSSPVYQIIRYLETHIYEIDALGRLEKEFNYNYRHISQSFLDSMEVTLREYFIKIRMEKAKTLLKSGKSVTETAELMGYSSVHPFSRAYKKYYGVSPAASI